MPNSGSFVVVVRYFPLNRYFCVLKIVFGILEQDILTVLFILFLVILISEFGLSGGNISTGCFCFLIIFERKVKKSGLCCIFFFPFFFLGLNNENQKFSLPLVIIL